MYNHEELEEAMFKFWVEHDVYKKQKEKVKNGRRIYFLDGPPYVTGEIHSGTGWNKVMKDMLIRYHRMRGFNIRDTPGFDTHGLPIEVKVEQKLGFKNKQDIDKIGMEKFINECKAFADTFIGVMTKQFKSLAVWMDWENPYVTYKNDYIEKTWVTIKRAHEKNLLYKGEYVLPYCPRCQTTLANYELEYWDETDPSIYVKFKIKGEENKYLIIWTTTPWTLVANMAVAANPSLKYAEVMVGDEKWILLAEKAEEVADKVGETPGVIREFEGSELEGIEYEHPFQDKIKKDVQRKVVLSEVLVSAEEGTGLVHIAPGHGPEDFNLGQEKGIEAFSPVDGTGKYTEEAGDFAGKNVREANIEIIDLLKNRGSLVAEERITHRYPHCWRCKTPLIYIKTDQWFFKITALKDLMLEESKKVTWVPNIAKDRFENLLKSAPDWCISRQRYWGIPLPIWKCDKCGAIKVIGSRDELPEKLDDLHRPYIDKVKFKCDCGGEMSRVDDVLDVWFDSGNAVWATQNGEWGDTADYILEGHDQIRGWFYSLLGSGIVHHDKVPYKTVVMHGFFVDEHGEKMSKSVGNYVPLAEIVTRGGVDSFRLFSLSTNVWEDPRFSWDAMKESKADINILINLISFLQRHYTEKITMESEELEVEDRWMLSRVNTTLKEYHKAINLKEIAKAVRAVRYLLVEDLSKKYMKIAKQRISDDKNKKAALYTIYTSVWNISLMLAPITPLAVEHIYQNFFKALESNGSESIHLIDIPDERVEYIDSRLEKLGETAFEVISKALMLRNQAKVKLRWPLSTIYISDDSSDVKDAVSKFTTMIKGLTNVKAINFDKPDESIETVCNEGICLTSKITEELYEEGMANEIIRRIQIVRKQKNLRETNFVPIIVGGDGELVAIAEKFKEHIQKKVHSSELSFGISPEEEADAESFMVDGKPLLVKVKA